MLHELKCWPEYYQSIIEGKKTFDVRITDRPFTEGDFILLQEFNPNEDEHASIPRGESLGYTGRTAKFKITFILSDEAFCKPGHAILALHRIPELNEDEVFLRELFECLKKTDPTISKSMTFEKFWGNNAAKHAALMMAQLMFTKGWIKTYESAE